ncbi:MAG: DNA-directed RNA polymerase subunit beta, partial [Firmicutes bacterium]|nr:DNA-directed RNA polymerase subunit beta [Bacillota bacterium]
MPKAVQLGRKERQTFSKINEVAEMPNLIQIQTKSYKWFLEEGLAEVFEDISPIQDYAGNLVLEFIDYNLSDPPKYDQETCKERDATYAAPLKVKVRLITNETGEVKEQEVFMGDFPIMTERGTFIYNGAERVVVTQLVRSPGPYYDREVDKSGRSLYMTTVIPNRGAWLEYETDAGETLSVRVDRTRKQPITTFLRALHIFIAAEQERFGNHPEGLSLNSDADLLRVFGQDPRLIKSIEKDPVDNFEDGLREVYRRLRPGEPPTVESARSLLGSLFFDPKRYDIAKVGRYKYNKKLCLSARLEGAVAAEDVVDPNTGEILVSAGETISLEKGREIENAGVWSVLVHGMDNPEETTKVIGNNFVDLDQYVSFDTSDLRVAKKVYYPVLMNILEEYQEEEDIKRALVTRKNDLSPKHITLDDIIASVSYLLNLNYGIGNTDDIDHLGNRRLRTVGELLQNQFRIGLSRMERVVKERITIQDMDVTTPQALINI